MRTMLARQLGRHIKPHLRTRRLINMYKNIAEFHRSLLSILGREG
jgi:hypothetical protein